MLYTAFFVVYFFLAFLTVKEVKRILLSGLTFINGVLAGLVFYIVIPLFFILVEGQLYIPDSPVSVFNPEKDVWTTINLFLGWSVILLSHFFSNRRRMVSGIDFIAHKRLEVMFFLYLALSVYGFIESGMLASDSHWHSSLSDTMSTSSFLIITKNFSFAYRTTIFGMLFYMYRSHQIKIPKAFFLGLVVVLFDLFTTFNRITVLYFFVFVFLVYIRRWKVILLSVFILMPLVAPVSDMWTTFRATNSGYSFDSFVEAYINTLNMTSDSGKDLFSVVLNSVFEASNILVFNGIVNNIGDGFPVLWGETFLIRPLTTFIPSAIWVDKPHVFGTYLGKYFSGHESLALNSTLFGEAIGNFYYFWPIALFVALIVVNLLFVATQKFVKSAGFMGFFIGFALWRFDMNFAISGLYSICFLWIIMKIIGFKERQYAWQ